MELRLGLLKSWVNSTRVGTTLPECVREFALSSSDVTDGRLTVEPRGEVDEGREPVLSACEVAGVCPDFGWQVVWWGCDGRVTGQRNLELYGDHAAQAALAAAPVVGRLDPADDRNGEVLAGLPGVAVEDVVWEEREERFHRGVVASGRDASHRPHQPVRLEGALVAA